MLCPETKVRSRCSVHLAMPKSLKPKTKPVTSSRKASYLKMYCASRGSTGLQTPLSTALNVRATCHLPFQISTAAVLCHPPRQFLADRDFILPVSRATAQEESGWDKVKAVLGPSVDRFKWVTRSQTIFRDISNLETSKSLVVIWPNSAKNTLGDLSWSSSLDRYWLTKQVAVFNKSLYPNW